MNKKFTLSIELEASELSYLAAFIDTYLHYHKTGFILQEGNLLSCLEIFFEGDFRRVIPDMMEAGNDIAQRLQRLANTLREVGDRIDEEVEESNKRRRQED